MAVCPLIDLSIVKADIALRKGSYRLPHRYRTVTGQGDGQGHRSLLLQRWDDGRGKEAIATSMQQRLREKNPAAPKSPSTQWGSARWRRLHLSVGTSLGASHDFLKVDSAEWSDNDDLTTAHRRPAHIRVVNDFARAGYCNVALISGKFLAPSRTARNSKSTSFRSRSTTALEVASERDIGVIGLKIRAQATCSSDAVNTLTLATIRVGVALGGRRDALGPSSGEGNGIHRI